MSTRPCPCGSGLSTAEWQYRRLPDGIELCRTCPKCHREKMRGYRTDVLGDSSYWADEAIEEE